MSINRILPEIYSFFDFTRHGCITSRKKGIYTYTTHIGGEIPELHPLPYNVYTVVSEHLQKYPQDIEVLISLIEEELQKPVYEVESFEITPTTYTYKKSKLSRKQHLPQINVTIQLNK
ncbi:MAG: hypothetical protein IKL73_00085 [Lachnospiraceae bacterium]|nr:hypothetical protein [Lachnospira sp.]MBR6696647.1 hypothetical protein [Lachnospiraceae bacterium]